MKTTLIILLVAISSTIFAQSLILDPALSADGSKIAFSYQGDIWTVPVAGGRADRITIHEGYDGNPKWSADGSKIAFTSDRYGNADVYTIPSVGGVSDRLTFHSASDEVASFTLDGNVLFTTARLYRQVERESEIYVAKKGVGTPERFMDAMGFDPMMSPDGSKVAFVRGTCRTAREAYRGPANRDLWIWDIKADTFTQLTNFAGNDFSPQWIDNVTLTYITPKSGKYNVHKIDLQGNDTQLSMETDFGINSYGLSAGGGKLVYQTGDKVKVLVLADNSVAEVAIDVASDFRFDPVVAKKVSNDIDEYAVSPNGKLSAYTHRGEVFVTRNDKEDSRSVRLTDGPARERDLAWISNEVLLFISDREGQNDLFLIRSADPEQNDLFQTLKTETVRVTKTSDQEEFSPVVSPDKKKLAYRQGRGRLLVADISTDGKLANEKVLLDGWDTPGGISWSPDSKWLAYSLSDLNFNDEIYIHAADNSQKPVNVSMHPKGDRNPVWSADGSKLGFASDRNNGDSDVWFVWLKKEDWQKSREARKREEKLDDDGDKKDNEEDKDKEETGVVVQIDFERIYDRLERVTGFAGGEYDFAFDKKGEWIYYANGSSGRMEYKVERDLYKIKWDGSDNTMVEKGNKRPGAVRLDPKGVYIYFLTQGGKLNRMKTKDDKSETLSVTSLLNINYEAERSQIFEEGWRALNAGFYDPEFHGYDWNALREKYRPIALKASTKEDFQFVFNLMLGQLNASHMGMYQGENQKETQSQKTGLIGVEGRNIKGGFEVTRVLTGSPADRNESRLNAGDIIASVNQVPVEQNVNFYAQLNATIDEPVLLGVKRKDGKNAEAVIWPVNSLSSELYDDWVEERRKLVDQYSGGKLGYLHIRGMNWSSFERFERELMAAGYGKDGIVIDVRYNGGGWTTDYLMAVLTVRQHAYTVPRGAAKSLPQEHLNFKETYPFSERLPLASWTKPSIALCNENSYSNAEIFSHAYKTLGLGTLVGKPTFGAVISTGGWGLVDGSYVRMPFRAWYVKATEENMEHGPAVPDIEVDNPPAYKAKGIDPQLKRAVEELLGQL